MRYLQMARQGEWHPLFRSARHEFATAVRRTCGRLRLRRHGVRTAAPPWHPPELPPLARHRSPRSYHQPTIQNFELTNRCPFRCIMCARTHHMTRPEGLMEFSLFRKVLDEYVALNPAAARHHELWLHGFGESLVHPQFAQFMRYATDRGVNAGLSINPLLLTADNAAALIAARPAHLFFPLDGHDDESFARIRGVKNAYTLSKARLLAFLAAKQQAGLRTRTTVVMIDFPANAPHLAQARDAWLRVPGVDHFVAKSFVTWDGNAPDVTRLVAPPPSNRAADPVRCTVPWRYLTVTWDGDVVPCCYDYDKKHVVGNAARESLAEIWNGAAMQALRREFIENRVTSPLCRNCDYLRSA